MKRQMLKTISTLLLIVFCLQLFSEGAYAQSQKLFEVNKTKNSQKEKMQPKGITPKKEKSPQSAKEMQNKKPVKIPAGLAKQEEKFAEWKNKKELTEKRWKNGKVYENADGSRTAVVFSEPIHVKDSEGKLQEIDNRLVAGKDEKGNALYKNTRGLFDASFGIKEKKPFTSIKAENITVGLTPIDFDVSEMAAAENQVVYGMEGRDIQYEYVVNATSVKENIVLNHYIPQNAFHYRLDVQGNAAVEAEDGKIIVKDKKTDEIAFQLSAPFMVDRENKRSKDLTLGLEKDKYGYIVTLTADAAWLSDPNRAYPVKIDPNISVSGFEVSYDTFVEDGWYKDGNWIPGIDPERNYYLVDDIYVGYADWRGRTRSFLQFEIEDQEFNSNSQVLSAIFRLYNKGEEGIEDTANLLVYRADSHIDVSEITWSNQPEVKGAGASLSYKEEGYYYWDITQLAESWVEENRQVSPEGVPAYSENQRLEMVLKMEDEYSSIVQFDSSDAIPAVPSNANGVQPFLQIEYIPKVTEPEPIPSSGDLELVLERDKPLDIGTVYAKNTLEWSSDGKNRATVNYRFMPEGTTGSETKENFSSWEVKTPKYDLEVDKAYWIEMDVKMEKWVEVLLPSGGSAGHFEVAYEKTMSTDKFVVGEAEPGDTLRKLSKHYLEDGDKYKDVQELNKLDKLQLILGQKLFFMTEKEKPYNYKQPTQVTEEMERKEALLGLNPVHTEMAGQFINPNTGNFALGFEDFSYQTYNYPVAFNRSYNSTVEKVKSPLGDRWEYSFNKYLFFYEDGTIGFNRGDGSRTYYRKDYSGKFVTTALTYEELEAFADGYRVTTSNNIQYIFNSEGLFTEIIDGDSNKIEMAYDSSDWQKSITDSLQRSIKLEYYQNTEQWPGNLKRVTLPDDSHIDYTYTAGSNHLKTSSDREGNSTIYAYQQNDRLTKVTLSELNPLFINSYDVGGRVLTQKDGRNNGISLAYGTGETLFTDAKTYTYKYIYNEKGWLTEKVYPATQEGQYTEEYNYQTNRTTFTDRRGQLHIYTYNDRGYLLKYEMLGKKTMSYEYKDGYLREKIIDFEGKETILQYDANNHLQTVKKFKYEDGQKKEIITSYLFTKEGLLSSVTDPDGVSLTIDNSQYPSKQVIKDINNHGTTYYYDTLGRTLRIRDAEENETSYSYDKKGQVLDILRPGDRLTTYSYDTNGRLRSESTNRVVPETDKTPVTTYDYYDNNLLQKITDPYNSTIEYGYDSNNNAKSIKNKDQNTSRYDYDSLNRRVRYYGPNQSQPSTEYEYDPLGNVTKVYEADGDWIFYSYDYAVNKVKYTGSAEGKIRSMEYDNMGNLVKEQDANNNITEYALDSLYQLEKMTQPGSLETHYEYYPSGRIKTQKDPLGKVFEYINYPDGNLQKRIEKYYDPYKAGDAAQTVQAGTSLSGLSRVGSFTTAAPEFNVQYTVEYTYDSRGNLETVKDEEGLITAYKYNEINRVEKVTPPGKNPISYQYDKEGNLEKVIDAKAHETNYKYDALSRLFKLEVPEEKTTYTYIYYPSGLLKEERDPNQNSIHYSYDEQGRMDKTWNDRGEETIYAYNQDNTLKSVKYPNMETVEYLLYDKLNRVKEYKDRSGVINNITYTPSGAPDLVYDTVGNRTDYNYDSMGRINSIMDALGKRKSFTYNEKNQVDTVTGFDRYVTRYGYDPRGRVRNIVNAENNITGYDYNGSNQVTTVTKPGDRTYTYEYDGSGNLWKAIDPLNNKTEYYYDQNNLLSESINARGYSKKYTYNALNKVKTATNERGYTTNYDYYPGGLLKTITDAKNNKTNYTYNELNKMETMTNALGETITYAYDNMGRLDTVKDQRDVWTKYAYTARDQVEYTYDSMSNFIQKIYYPNGDLWKNIDQENRTTEYKYDAGHRVTSIINPGGYAQNFTYDPVTGDISRKYDNAGSYTDFQYDAMYRLLKEINQQGLSTSYAYDIAGNLTSKTTPDGNTEKYEYDDLGRITSILDPEQQLTKIHYDTVGNIDSLVKPRNQEYIYSYDPANNLEKVLDPLNRETLYTYDKNNNVETLLTPSKNLIHYNYDPLNRLQETLDSLNGSKVYGYDASGNINAVKDGNGYTTNYHYDSRNLLEWVEDAEGNKTSYTYYNDGKLKTMTDGRNKTSSYTYSAAGYLETFKNPLGEVKKYEYTLTGQIDKIIKPDGNPIDYIYDSSNRLQTIKYPDENTVEYQYDYLSRKTAMSDKNGVTEYAYDKMGRLTQTLDPANEEVKFEYDEKGRKSKVIYPDDKYVTYGYDEYDRLVTVTDRENRITTYTYDESGRKKTVKLPNGITTTYHYDVVNRIKEILNTKENGTVVEKIAYDYDGEGNKTLEEIWKEDKHYRREYTYYKNNTVKSMAETGDNTVEYSYHYDPAGNIDSKTVTEDGITKTYTYTYNDANRMVTELENGKVRRSYKYDLNGNRTQRIISDDGKPVADYYYYDYTDQLEEVVEHNGKVYTYGYDGEGNRLWRTFRQYPVVKPPVEDGERVQDPAEFPGWNKDNQAPASDKTKDKDSDLDHDKGKGNDFKVEGGGKKGDGHTSYLQSLMDNRLAFSVASLTFSDTNIISPIILAKKDDSDSKSSDNSSNGNGGNSSSDNGNSSGNGNDGNSSSGNGNSDNDKGNGNKGDKGSDKEPGKGERQRK